MSNPLPDYKVLYEQAQLEQKLALDLLSDKEGEIASLNFELNKLRKYIFGSKSEKIILKETDVNQMGLFDMVVSLDQQEELGEQAIIETEKKKPAKKRAKGTSRMMLPADLPREEIIIEPLEDTTGCRMIGQEVTEVLEVKPAELYVKRYIRRKYARLNGEGVLIGNLPDRAIEKGIPSESLVAQMIVDKYVFGLPLHRQIDKYRRLGVNIPASSASDWMLKGWHHLVPLWELLKLLIVNQKYLQADETPFKVQDRDHKKGIHQGYMWLYHAPLHKLVLFDYRKGRNKEGPSDILGKYEGILQTDGYSVYEELFGKHDKVKLVFCMAHARRKFVEALNYDKKGVQYVLGKMQVLYLIEQQMRETQTPWQQRAAIRQQEAIPILNELKDWMIEAFKEVLPKSPMGVAIGYTLPRWEGLTAYTLHGQLEIDNNWAENAIRPIAIGRKNYLFAGSHQAAEMTAAMYSFMATCKKNQVDEFEWIKDVLQRIQSHKHRDLYQLLPNNWKKYQDITKEPLEKISSDVNL